MTTEQALRIFERYMEQKAAYLRDPYVAPELKERTVSAIFRNFTHYQNAGGTKTLAEILKGDS